MTIDAQVAALFEDIVDTMRAAPPGPLRAGLFTLLCKHSALFTSEPAAPTRWEQRPVLPERPTKRVDYSLGACTCSGGDACVCAESCECRSFGSVCYLRDIDPVV